MSKIKDKEIFYLDESGFDIDMQKQYGYYFKKERLIAERSGNRKDKRISVIAVSNNKNQLLNPFYFKGSTNKEVFRTYLTACLESFS